VFKPYYVGCLIPTDRGGDAPRRVYSAKQPRPHGGGDSNDRLVTSGVAAAPHPYLDVPKTNRAQRPVAQHPPPHGCDHRRGHDEKPPVLQLHYAPRHATTHYVGWAA